MLNNMILELSPETQRQRSYRQEKIHKRFPELKDLNYCYYLDLWKYIGQIPERFFSLKAYEDLSSFLKDLKNTDPENLAYILKEYAGSFSVAFRSLAEVNALPIHDIGTNPTSSSDQYDLLQFCIENINPNYLKLIEAVYANLILPIAAYQRLARSAKLEGFDIFQRSQELESGDYNHIIGCYRHIIRNGIAHGNVKLIDNELIYEDREKSDKRSPAQIIDLFNDTVDICNGLALALRVFYMHDQGFIRDKGVLIPTQILLEELQSEIDAPGWRIKGCLSSQTLFNTRSQLIIFVSHNIFDPLKIDYYLLRSAVFAEMFYPGYERYFFKLSSESLPSWASFHGKELEMRRLNNISRIEDYIGVWEQKVVFSKYSYLPRIIFKISTFVTVMKSIIPLEVKKTMENIKELVIAVRVTKMHRTKYYSVLRASVIVEANSEKPLEDLIRANCTLIAKTAMKMARKNADFNDFSRYLSIRYLRISIFARDYRIRKLENSGLMPDLLCTLELNRTKTIKTIDIAGGIPEVIGNYRIAWNKRANILRINPANSYNPS